MSDEALELLRSRGHWKMTVRPASYDRARVDYAQLESLIVGSAVRLRGWPLPYVDYRDPWRNGEDWIGQDIDARAVRHFEAWRFFTSGQFQQLRSFTLDWEDEIYRRGVHPDTLPVWEILFYLTEVFELAARLAMSEAGVDAMVVTASLHGLSGRRLVDSREGLHLRAHGRAVEVESLEREMELTRGELAADARSPAVHMSREFIARFGVQVSHEQLAGYQQRLLER